MNDDGQMQWSGAAVATGPAARDDSELRARTFMCKDVLWKTFQQIAAERGMSMDDLLADAMRAYAHHRSVIASGQVNAAVSGAHDYSLDDSSDMARTAARPNLDAPAPMDRFSASTGEAPAIERAPWGPKPTPAPFRAPPAAHAPPPPPPPPSRRATPPPFASPFAAPLGPPSSSRSSAVPAPPRSVPPPLPSAPQVIAAQSGQYGTAGALTLTYQGKPHDVRKDRYLLGRSKTQADLRLDDSNVSRQHAAIERVGDGWYVVDLGSTNGVYVGGQRVTRHRLASGDVIEITTHEIRCALA